LKMNKSYVEFGKGKTYQALKKWVYTFAHINLF
jgi:hypothetical protein